MDTIHIMDTDNFKGKMHRIQSWWVDKLHVLADFDRTLTKWFYKGMPISSIASFLYEDGTMSKEYQTAGKALFDYYYPIEQDESIDRETKKIAMDKRWEAHLNLMVEYKLSYKDLEHVVTQKALQLREWCNDFFALLHRHKIPTIIMSASGIGYDSIGLFLRKNDINQEYIDILSNAFVRDNNWYAIGRKDPVIHSMNKNEITVHSFPTVYQKIATRKNVILLWDSLHDIEMIDWFAYDTMLSIGFCLSEKKKVKDLFIQTYDIVIFDDGDMRYPIQILEQLLQ